MSGNVEYFWTKNYRMGYSIHFYIKIVQLIIWKPRRLAEIYIMLINTYGAEYMKEFHPGRNFIPVPGWKLRIVITVRLTSKQVVFRFINKVGLSKKILPLTLLRKKWTTFAYCLVEHIALFTTNYFTGTQWLVVDRGFVIQIIVIIQHNNIK